MRALAFLLAFLALPVGAAAPVVSVGSPSAVSLQVDVRYAVQDSDSAQLTLTVFNSGNQTLVGSPLGNQASAGLMLQCTSNCNGYTVAAGGSRGIGLQVTASQDSPEGNLGAGYVLSFTNAAPQTASIPVHVTKLEPGRLQVSVVMDAPDFPCPAPALLPLGGTLVFTNVGDTELSSARTTVNGPGAVALMGSLPTALAAGQSASVRFQVSVAPPALGDSVTVGIDSTYSSSRAPPPLHAESAVAIHPPVEFLLGSAGTFASELNLRPSMLGILEPFAIPLEFRETCGYRALTIHGMAADDHAAQVSPVLPTTVPAGATVPATLSITIPLSQVGALCSGYANRLRFSAQAIDAFASGTVVVKAPVDLAGARSALDRLAGESQALQGTPLGDRVDEVSRAFAQVLGGGDCSHASAELKDVLAAAPPIAWSLQIAAVEPQRSAATVFQGDAVLAVGAMAAQLQTLCGGLASAAIRGPCGSFASAYASVASDRLAAVEQQAQARLEQATPSERVGLTGFLLQVQRLRGDAASTQWQGAYEAAQQTAYAARTAAMSDYVSQIRADQSWLRNADQAAPADFTAYDPVSIALAEARYGATVRHYSQAATGARQAGDDALAQRIDAATATVRQAHHGAQATNLVFLGLWCVAALGVAALVAARAVAWRRHARGPPLGDVLTA